MPIFIVFVLGLVVWELARNRRKAK